MSLLSTVEHAIKSYKVEQAKINDSIKLYREILQRLTPRPKADSKDSESEEDAAADTDASPKEREDIELLERALEKALRVRTGSEPRTKLSGTQKDPGSSSVASVDVAAAASKRSQATIKSSSTSASLDRTGQRKPGQSVTTKLGSRPLTGRNPARPKNMSCRNIIPRHPPSSAGAAHHQASRKLQQQPVSSSGSSDHISNSLSKNKPIRSSVPCGDDPGKAASVSTPSSNDILALSGADGPGAGGVLRRCGTPTEQTVKWKSLRSKQNRLWDKVIAVQRKPEPGRGRFMERMRATFPEDWPYGSPDQTRALADRLTHRGHDLIQICQAKELLAKRSPGAAAAAPDDKESGYGSCLAPGRLQLTAAELQTSADQVKQNWKAWDRWMPEGGCLCPSGANGVRGDEITAPLPLTVTYTTEAELQELERLRTSVALLQQEIYLEQALWDALSPQLSSIEPGPGCPNASVLRDLYSLLGEGGKRFPAIVLDSEAD